MRQEIQRAEEVILPMTEKKQINAAPPVNLRYQGPSDFVAEEGIEIMVPARKIDLNQSRPVDQPGVEAPDP